MDRILVVVYSHTGTSRRLAQLLCSQFQSWQLGTIVEERTRAGAIGTLRCLLDSLLRRRPRIRYEGPDPADFDMVALVSPIWAGRLAGPMRSFVVAQRQCLKQVAVVSVMGQKGAPSALAEVARVIGRTPAFAMAFTAREIDDGSCAAHVQALGQALHAATRHDMPALRPAVLSPEAA
jgi:flavodoxin